jgi:hypothetical protein
VAALLRLLDVADENDGDKLGIFSYVAATSRRKMLRGLGHDSHSNSFFGNLLDLPPLRAKQSARPFPDRHPTLDVRDAAFLEALSAPLNEDVLRLSAIAIPHLMEMALAYKPSATIPQVYTDATCEEFHRLLCHVLHCCDVSLTKLNTVDTHPPVGAIDQFEMAVYGVATCGLTLQTLANTSFIDEHMHRVLPPSLRSQRRRADKHGKTAEEEPIPEVTPTGMDFGDGNESPHAYADWLRSLVAPFRAADELIKVAPRIRSTRISIEILTIPDCGTSMRPWKQAVKEVMCSSTIAQSFECSEQEAIEAIESLASKNKNLGQRLKGDMLLGQNFRGTVHAQACLASFIHLRNSPERERDGLVSFVCEFLRIYLIPCHS